jgi:hypothetical protein
MGCNVVALYGEYDTPFSLDDQGQLRFLLRVLDLTELASFNLLTDESWGMDNPTIFRISKSPFTTDPVISSCFCKRTCINWIWIPILST